MTEMPREGDSLRLAVVGQGARVAPGEQVE